MRQNMTNLAYFLVLAVLCQRRVFGDCIWYDQCGISPENGKMLNCAYDGKPVVLSDAKAQEALARICPHVVQRALNGTHGSISGCCAKSQIEEMEKSFEIISALLGRCPSCLYNFRMVFCEMSCSPAQSSQMRVTRSVTARNGSGKNVSLVQEVEFSVSTEFARGVFESCKDVVNPSTSGSVLNLLCGAWGELCTPQRLFHFLGDLKNQNTPIQINFVFVDNNSSSSSAKGYFNPTTVPCNAAPPSSTQQGGTCSCTDCEAACVPPKFEVSNQITDYELHIALAVAGIFVAGAVAFLTVAIFAGRGKVHPVSDQGSEAGGRKWWDRNLWDIEDYLRKIFEKIGFFCASYPLTTLLLAFVFIAVCSCGVIFSRVTTDPIELWSTASSRSRIERKFFDETFGPFFRVSQVIVRPSIAAAAGEEVGGSVFPPFKYRDLFDEETTFSPIFHSRFMLEVLRLQKAIEGLVTPSAGIRLKDVCHQPLHPEKDTCNIQNVWSYWQDSEDEFLRSGINAESKHNDTYLDHFLMCIRNPTLQNAPTYMSQSCMSKGGIPVQPYFVLGGVSSNQPTKTFANATAFIITLLLNNNSTSNEKALEWEKTFTEFMTNWTTHTKPEFLDVSYYSERSVQDEIERSSYGDIHIIDDFQEADFSMLMVNTKTLKAFCFAFFPAISYGLMILFIILTLGQVSSCSRLTVELKIILSLFGTVLILLAIISAIGIFGYIGVATTLIVFQILPFLVLGVGTNNIYILYHTLQRDHPKADETHCSWISRVVGEVGPSMFMSSSAHATATLLGALSDMPAVRAFSLYASLSLTLNFLLQLTAFVAFTSLDLGRQMANRHDVLCCFKSQAKAVEKEWFLQDFFVKFYTPVLLSQLGRKVVVLLFLAWTCTSLYFIPHMHVGLEQEVVMPDDSYVLKYLHNLRTELSVGPPVYFVVNSTGSEFDYSDRKIQNLLCGGQGCNADSLQAQIKLWSKRSNVTYIAAPSQSWIDDFFDWSKHCCTKNSAGAFCNKQATVPGESSDYGDFGDYGHFQDSSPSTPETDKKAEVFGDYGHFEASPTTEKDHKQVHGEKCTGCIPATSDRPEGIEFRRSLPWFILENPSKSCPKAGKAAYKNAMSLELLGNRSSSSEFHVRASSFFTFHSVLRDSSDFTEAMRWSRQLARNLTEMLNAGRADGSAGVTVFPYSVFYVFYEQYLAIVEESLRSVGISLAAVFVVVLVMSGFNLSAAATIILIVAMTVTNLAGMMVWSDISLNAISLVNLVMTVGISVEFSSHMMAAFSATEGDNRLARARKNMNEWGVILLVGVHTTNLIAIIILGFVHSQIFFIYYFRMYVGLVLIGAAHGLVLLPVLLSYFGPQI